MNDNTTGAFAPARLYSRACFSASDTVRDLVLTSLRKALTAGVDTTDPEACASWLRADRVGAGAIAAFMPAAMDQLNASLPVLVWPWPVAAE